MLNVCVCVCFTAVLEPDVGPEHHRRSSSMRVTGTSYRGIVRERSSDDCIIGTHLGMGTLHITTTAQGFVPVAQNHYNLHGVGWVYTKVSVVFQLHSGSKTSHLNGNLRHSQLNRGINNIFSTDVIVCFLKPH